ncbi:hypothetical protein [Azospirillum argentinense]|uniref:hypothetical protein n=1 Tax=Azospirillum argentinense TaxID=2970906 RepID=UPI0032E02043
MAMKELTERFNAGETLNFAELDQLRIFYENLEGRLRKMTNGPAPTAAMIETHADVEAKLFRVRGMLKSTPV